MTRVVPMLLLVASVLAGGCLEPHRVHVPDHVLSASPVEWTEERLPLDSQGLLGPKSTETRYRHDPTDGGPPYPGMMQVFSVRRIDSVSSEDLLARVQRIVDEAMEREHIEPEGAARHGTRTLASGVDTRWFLQKGTVRDSGSLFERNVEVHILGEVGIDGRSRTEFMTVALVQVARTVDVACPPLLPTCDGLTRERDETTWANVAGDPEATLGPTSAVGLAWSLETHG